MTAGSIAVPKIIPIRVPLPGKIKHHVDTATPVEIKSDTPDVTIYYTLDGSRPEAVKRSGPGESSTLEYKEPIYLPKGKVSVKAVATTSDGRESSVVSKLFLVDYVPSNEPLTTEDAKEKVVKDYGQNSSIQQDIVDGKVPFLNTAKGVENTWEDTLKDHHAMKTKCGDSCKSSKASLFHKTLELQSSDRQIQKPHAEDLPGKSLTNIHISRIQRETDFLRCPQCLSLRPSDPFARFCLQCGTLVPLIPAQRLPPTEGAQTGRCACCKVVVPVNTPLCVVCEAPMAPQLQPQASLRLQDKVICQSCGTGNPAHIDLCVTCEMKLPELLTAVEQSDQRAPTLSRGHSKMVSCNKCRRVNSSDARFCDWCGAKVIPLGGYLTCTRCGANGHPFANFCGCCGIFLEGPLRPDSQTVKAGEEDQMGVSHSDSAVDNPVPLASLCPVDATPTRTLVDQHTQTVGLFFPSSTKLQKMSEQLTQAVAKQGQMRDRRPLLSAVSPGRGYWRKQLDHICAHLRSYTLNNPEFRALIGEPRMGKIVSSTVQEDDNEISLRINFASAGSERQGSFVEKFLDLSENHPLNSMIDERTGLSGSQTSFSEQKRSKKNFKNSFFQNGKNPPESKDKQLLREVGPEGKGQIAVVQQLLDEGADPSCQDSDGRPALTVAVMNQHQEVIPLLVQKGADINQQSGPMNNTALHEAAACGNHGLQCAEILLGCNANIRKKNNLGLTACDLAVRHGCGPLVSLIAAKAGQGTLDSPESGNNISPDAL